MNNIINEIKWKKEQLKRGCILSSIAHAIMITRYPDLVNEHSWDGINYNIQDSAGTRGTITFDLEYCIAAFRMDSSKRINSSEKIKQSNEYFIGAPNKIIELAESETLQYLLENVNGVPIPIITTAFWSEGEKLFTVDSFNDMYENGGFLLKRQLMDVDKAIESWKEYYDMSARQSELLRKIFERKIANFDKLIVLTASEIEMIESSNQVGLEESKNSFKELNIILNNEL
ncbi:MAG: hypothetical protein PHD15_05735 [Clostridia bacterium]|nr:hypothetical protein [Clostridia bacterium]MDD4387233.1 hypothetical protein [Clostridia bacterium]